jgi:DNA polymerase-3 subunit chi
MLRVDFHTGVGDPLSFACRLLRKASRHGARLAVTAPPQALQLLDRSLWTFEERDFVPHVRVRGAVPRVLVRTPIWLLDAALPEPAPPVLINLGDAIRDPWPGLERVIEIVGNDVDEAAAARQRWRQYKERGWPVTHHPASEAKAP